MTAPAYVDDSVTVHLGDCLNILATLPDCSVDAVVTDPPYLLGFMAREWDTKAAHEHLDWHRAWCDQAIRVLKPGGHMLAFGGTRTSHRLTCAIEDAGFEIRDSIAWLYGSGFPKSLDVSKAIDKAGGDPTAFRTFARAYRDAIEMSPITHTDVDRHLGIKSSSCYWARDDHRGGMPPRQHWEAVRELLDLSADLARLYDEAEREVVGIKLAGIATPGDTDRHTVGGSRAVLVDVTAPATDAAREWQGWGTALKPAHEPIVVARKPLAGTVAQNVLAYGTGALDIDACRVARDEPVGKPSSGPHGKRAGIMGETVERYRETTAAATAGRWPANVVLDEHYEPVIRLRDNLPTETERIIREFFGADTSHMPAMRNVSDRVAESGYETEVLLTPVPRGMDDGEPDWRERAPLRQGAHAGVSTQDERDEEGAAANGPEESSVARRNLSGARVRDGQSVGADGRGADADCPDDPTGRHSCSHPSTPADSCEDAGPAAVADRACAPSERREGRQPSRESGGSLGDRAPAHPRGSRPGVASAATRERRAAGACLDVLRRDCPPGWRHHFDVVGSRREGQAAALDASTGVLTSGILAAHHRREPKEAGILGAYGSAEGERGYGDSGGAARFFPTFKYEPKAPGSERPGADGVAHPTVKPLDLMRWLVRLVTPRGGLVLDPFAGSGTTGEACVVEGFRCILIEREPTYLPLIVARLSKPIQAGLDFGDEVSA